MSHAATVRAVLFDFSGTLYDDHGALTATRVVEHARRRGFALAEDEAAELVERTMRYVNAPEQHDTRIGADLSTASHRRVWTGMIGAAGPGTKALADVLYEALTDNDAWYPYPDAPGVVAELVARGIRVGVLSNIGWDIRPALVRVAAPDVLGAIVLSCEVGLEKPDPRIFALACERLGCEPSETLFVGDDPSKDGPAVRAGLAVYLLPDERRRDRPRGLAAVLPLATSRP
jgi:HAD superfamily hydrolase (TIGR01509 family)